MHPELSAILRMCANPLSIAEISAYLALPASTVMVLVADLVDSGQAEARAPAAMQARPRIELLEAVMDGLSKI
jgi:DNA-binding IclR family transcriptional regulator